MIGVNVWSGTDYTGTVTSEQTETSYFNGSYGLEYLESTNEWSTKGNKSLKQTYSSGDYCEFVLSDIDVTKTYTAKLSILSNTNGSLILIAKDDNNNNSTQSVHFNASDSVQHLSVSISGSDLEGKTQLRMRLRTVATGVIYSDNWELLES